MTRYRTIVADPPWDHSDGTGFSYGANDPRGRSGKGAPKATAVPYQTMTLEAITALPVGDLAEADAHLYPWTTNRYLRAAYDIAAAWGFAVVKPLIWCKEPMGSFGRPFTSSAEFVLYARRGVLPAKGDCGRQWWVWPRSSHSAKPEAFLDIVQQVSAGPYLEMFARRDRLGWDTWGDESLGTAEVAA